MEKKLAWEKAGIIKNGSVVCLGDTDDEIEELILQENSAKILRRGIDFACLENDLAIGGRHLSLRINDITYENIFLSQHGVHQGQNAAIAPAGATAFLGLEIPVSIVENSFSRYNFARKIRSNLERSIGHS